MGSGWDGKITYNATTKQYMAGDYAVSLERAMAYYGTQPAEEDDDGNVKRLVQVIGPTFPKLVETVKDIFKTAYLINKSEYVNFLQA